MVANYKFKVRFVDIWKKNYTSKKSFLWTSKTVHGVWALLIPMTLERETHPPFPFLGIFCKVSEKCFGKFAELLTLLHS